MISEIKENYRIFILFLILLSILIWALIELSKPVTTQDVYQYIDYDAQVVCYILENGNGISCLPLSEVNIER
jgi:hypothetical protein